MPDFASLLIPDVCHSLVTHFQLEDLLRWRATCHGHYSFAVDYLRGRRHRLLHPFTTDPDGFADVLLRHRSLIGGMFALAFVLLGRSLSFKILEIYSPDTLYADAVRDLEPLLNGPVVRYSVVGNADKWGGRAISEYTHFHLRSGYSVVLIQSTTWSALLPICRSPCTLLFNYVSQAAFGCGYPTMTMQGIGLLADHGMSHALPFEFDAMNSLTQQGFVISWSPVWLAWSHRSIIGTTTAGRPRHPFNLALSSTPHKRTTRMACSAHRFLEEWGVPPGPERFHLSSARTPHPCFARYNFCPRQTRYFGDHASLVDFFEPLSGDPAFLLENWMIPYGTVVLWTLRSSYSCASRPLCGHIDPDRMLFRDDGYIYLPALPGVNKFERRISRHHPPLYLFFRW